MKPQNSHDELLWLIAETGDDSAFETHLKRYPEDRLELLKRAQIVHKLKQSKPDSLGVPAFSPQKIEGNVNRPWRKTPDPRRVWILASLAPAFAIAAGVSWVAMAKNQPISQKETLAQNRPPIVSDPRVALSPTPAPSPYIGQDSIPDPVPQAPVVIESIEDVLVSFTAQDQMVSQVLASLRDQSMANFDFAPGFEDSPVSIQLDRVPLHVALQELGALAGFTCFHQEGKTFLVIPARDHSEDREPVENMDQGTPGGNTRTNPEPNSGLRTPDGTLSQ